MNHETDWSTWNNRLSILWPDSLRTMQLLGEEGSPPTLVIDGVKLSLAPSFWGLGEPENDVERVQKALETVIQGHAPEYWRTSEDPLVQALGWVDRRIGKRSWRQHDELHASARNPLEQQIRALRDHADLNIDHPAPAQKAVRFG